MNEEASTTGWRRWKTLLLSRVEMLRQSENKVFLVLSLVIGALTGLSVVAFIVLTERLGMRLYPVGGAPWRRLLFPVVGSLGIGYLLWRYFPDARGSGIPQTKAALFVREGASRCAPCWASSSALGDARERHPAGPRRTFGAGGRGHRLRARARCWD